VSEDSFLQYLVARTNTPDPELIVPPGDDCAALDLGTGQLLLLAVDQVVGDRHYFLNGPQATAPERVGRKLLARNLSDIAAMGGTPTYCLVAMALDPNHDEAWLKRFYSGIMELGEACGVRMIGGDLSRTPTDNVASLSIVGTVPAAHVCRRQGAEPGDLLFATGCFGASFETAHHLDFDPRCAEGRWLAGTGAVKAMIDVSDGLLLDATRVCRASGVGLRLDPAAILPRRPGLSLKQLLTDGEDYELLFAVAPERAAALRDWPFEEVPLTRIGEFVASATPEVTGPSGAPLGDGLGGWDHFEA
jgi:thiamine-monophosphate kinase